MAWLVGGIILLVVGVFLHRLLGLGRVATPPPPRNNRQEGLCQTIAAEIECRSGILAVLLNDAIEELAAGNVDNTRELLSLAELEWTNLAELLNSLLRTMTDFLPLAPVTVPVRGMAPSLFRSDVMIDYLRLHELVDQFLFRTKQRFHLQVRILRHAIDILTTDFRRAQPKVSVTRPSSRAIWTRLDSDFHDFDLISKKTLLAFRKFVSWLPESAASDFAVELRPVLDRGVRSDPREKRSLSVSR